MNTSALVDPPTHSDGVLAPKITQAAIGMLARTQEIPFVAMYIACIMEGILQRNWRCALVCFRGETVLVLQRYMIHMVVRKHTHDFSRGRVLI